jgi:hypothetical protein
VVEDCRIAKKFHPPRPKVPINYFAFLVLKKIPPFIAKRKNPFPVAAGRWKLEPAEVGILI